MPTTETKTYEVANPRSIPQGTVIISLRYGKENLHWYEGDDFVKPDQMTDEQVEGWIDKGYLVDKK